MALICPTVLASEAHEYRIQLEKVVAFASRIQIDLMDGEFAPSRSINPIQAYWPPEVIADIHLMFQRPLEHIETLVSLKPHMVIIHAEASGDLLSMLAHLKKFGIATGVALLRDTAPEDADALIREADHVLLFSGDLGHFGGSVNMKILEKVVAIKAINPDVEIGWDGGANEGNVRALADGGVDVINVGGAIQNADNPKAVFEKLQQLVA
jgi:ribulose-phosphate 3-epimerase